MLRYIAIIRSDDSPNARALHFRMRDMLPTTLPEFTLAYKNSLLYLFCADSTPGRIRTHSLNRDGVVLGTLFPSSGGAHSAISQFTPEEAHDVVATTGSALITKYWGQYIAIVRRSANSWRLIRDPTGGLPCYFTRSHGIVTVFSHLTDSTAFIPSRLTINEPHLLSFLDLHRFVPRDTGFSEVDVAHAGEAIDLSSAGVTRAFLWEPSRFCTLPSDDNDIDGHVTSLRSAVVKCVHSWAESRRSILHELSGGLDSSIVLACLAEAPSSPRIACCTYFTESAQGDERFYAALMAKRANLHLFEVPLRSRAWNAIDSFVRVRDPISPLYTSFDCDDDSTVTDLVTTENFDSTFSGQGGDHLFNRTIPSITAADYVWNHGLNAKAFRVIADTAYVARQSLWNIAAQTMIHGYFRRPYDIWRELRGSSFIRNVLVDASERCHPWVAAPSPKLPPAKFLQIMCLTETQTYFATPRPYVDEIHPLISQPLLECCLRIPTYILSHGGIDRTIARFAFKDQLPREILHRVAKGAVNQLLFNAVYNNRQKIRSFLLDGLLASRGVFDRTLLDKTLLDPTALTRGTSLVPIMTATICEKWLRAANALARRTRGAELIHRGTIEELRA